MLICSLLLCIATLAFGDDQCDYLIQVKSNEVKELQNPSYPLKDDPGKNCTWTVVADVDRRIVLVCPLNDGSDTRSDKRKQCGAQMSIWDAGGEPTTYCRDQTFSRIGTSNRMFINYTNDDGKFYNRTSGFKCYVYATFTSLLEPYDKEIREAYEKALFRECDYFIKLNKYEIVRLAASNYTEDSEKWRRCRWTAVSPQGSKISITCPYTEIPPEPLLIQPLPCTNEFTIMLLQYSLNFQCSDRSFSDTSKKNRLVLEQLAIRRLPPRDFECYVHSEPADDGSALKPSPYQNCDHVIKVNGTVTIKSPNNPEVVESGTVCRWTVIAPENSQISYNCSSMDTAGNVKPQKTPCPAEFNIMEPGGKTTRQCQEGKLSFSSSIPHNWFTLTYKNPSSSAVEPFTCTLSHGPQEKCENCTETIAGRKYKVIKLEKREVKEILSPNYPEKEPSLSTGHWTVVADTDRRVVVVCPFHQSDEAKYTSEDPPPCTGELMIAPENGEESYHCQERGFARIGANHIMVFRYQNQQDKPLNPVKCYAYAELNERWDQLNNYTESGKLDFEGFDYEIKLRGTNMTTLVPPTQPEDVKKLWRSRWNVTAVNEAIITIACHFTNKPPAPITIQVGPCYGEFTIESKEGSKTHKCREGAFSHTTSSGWMVLMYQNPQKRPAENFVCVAYSRDKVASKEVTSLPYENEACDYMIDINVHDTFILNSALYDIKKDSGRSTCRWTFVTPVENHLTIVCPGTHETVAPSPSELRCHNQLTVLTEGRKKTMHCAGKTFSRTSINNMLVLIYENEFRDSVEPFSCKIHALEKEKKNATLPALIVSGNIRINLNTSADVIESPYYPKDEPGGSIFTWVVVSPPGSRIILTCPPLEDSPAINLLLGPCHDIPYFAVSSEQEPTKIEYCRRWGFIHTSVKNQLKVVYYNPSKEKSENFKCEVRPFVDLPWNECDTCDVASEIPYEQCNQFLKLTHHASAEFKYPKGLTRGTNCRWTVVSPHDTRVLISCPVNDFRTQGSLDPCSSYYTVSNPGNVTTYCRTAFLNNPSPANWSILTYENPSRDTVNRFSCFAYVEKQLDSKCGNCSDFEKLDYSMCHLIKHINQTGTLELLQTPNYPKDMPSGVPCLWTVRAPLLTTLSMTCDLGLFDDQTSDENAVCRGLITVYRPGKDPQYMCRHQSFGVAAPDNQLTFTYGNQYGVTNKGFKCHVRAVNATCHYEIPLGHLHYNEFYKIYAPFFNSSVLSPPSCTWSFESPKNTTMDLFCDGGDRIHSMAVSTRGHPQMSDKKVYPLSKIFKVTSSGNKLRVRYYLNNATTPMAYSGCRVYVDTGKKLAPECDCSNKFNRMKTPLAPLRGSERGPAAQPWFHTNTFPMVAAILRTGSWFVYCPGAIISPLHVISSASCFDDDSALYIFKFNLILLVGAHESASDGESNYRPITKYVVHPEYTKGPRSIGNHDLAITFVDIPIKFNEYIRPTCLPFQNRGRSFENEPIIFTGWKQDSLRRSSHVFDTSLDILNANRLLKMEGHIPSKRECISAYGLYSDDPLCAIYPNRELANCPDSRGGPVFWKDPKTSLLKLIGIDVRRRGCGEKTRTIKTFPSKVMSIIKYLDWIKKVAVGASFCEAE